MLLDIVRFVAAIGVVVTHAGEDTFGTGWTHNPFWGDLAVPVFFVLSGFVIRFVTRTREGNPREYYIDRASRIYSVAIPAMLMTLLCSLLCLLLQRDRFLHDWAPLFSDPIARLVANLTFLSQMWGHNTIPYINSPFWSLGFECPYYVFYGFIFFLRGWKRLLACAVLAALVGPQVVFLLPLWWSGVWMYDAYYYLRGKSAGLVAAIVLVLWVAISIVSGFFAMGRFPFAIQTIFLYIASRPNLLGLLSIPIHRATMFAYAAGLVSAVVLFLALLAIDGASFSPKPFLKDKVRRVADGTFILYLFHYPLLLLVAYARLFRYQHNSRNVAVVTGVVLFCVLLAAPLDTLKLQMRRWLRAVIPD
jgi:peptidoglycan/LPS O-acetylase OafA/YrhL